MDWIELKITDRRNVHMKNNSGSYKRYALSGDEVWDEGKGISDLIAKMQDDQLEDIREMIIGCWGESYDNSSQQILDFIVENKDRFQELESLFVGDMEQEESEVSWIQQGDFTEVLQVLPNLKKLMIKGTEGLVLPAIEHEKLEFVEIITGGLPVDVISALAASQLPHLKTLILYLGVEDYGFNADIEDIKLLLSKVLFPSLNHLGIVNSEIQNKIAEAVLQSDLIPQLQVLEFSMGCLTDVGGQFILDHKDQIQHLEKLDLHFHYLSNDMMSKLGELPITIDLSEQEQVEEYQGDIYMFPMLTE